MIRSGSVGRTRSVRGADKLREGELAREALNVEFRFQG